MKIKTSSLLLLGFAVVLAGCAAFVARGLLAPHAAERPAEERILSAEYNTKLCEISLLQISGKITKYLEQ